MKAAYLFLFIVVMFMGLGAVLNWSVSSLRDRQKARDDIQLVQEQIAVNKARINQLLEELKND